ncbi:MAG: rod shape-determining protein MreC [Desulfovibrio sp.]|jgi:rod shape-determining protein MreC|nr:rod shape-determining protein MreC [Desulfovibrio sp.]
MFLYLALYTWNARTGYLDTIAERTGLEVVGHVLSPVVWVKDRFRDWWERYMALVDISEENSRLRTELERARAEASLTAEDKMELGRLRELLGLEALRQHPAFAARIIAKRFGPQAVLRTFTIDKGFLDGAITGTPVVTQNSVVGRVLRASPHTATVLMLTDPGFRLAVISRESRTPGILTGSISGQRRLEVAYVAQNANIAVGETLITSGVDGSFPKGVPVGVVTQVTPGNEILFLQVHAQAIVDIEKLEEVLLLMDSASGPPLLPPLPGSQTRDPISEAVQKKQNDAPENKTGNARARSPSP